MNERFAVFFLALAFAGAAAPHASGAEVKGAAGPIQLTLRLHAATVNAGRSLWYKLELKNVGKRRLRVFDRVFRDPWAMNENCKARRGLYLEILLPDGKPLWVRPGGGQMTWDYAPKPGQTKIVLTPEEKGELHALEADAVRLGWTAQQKSVALGDWNARHHQRKQLEELSDPAKQAWLSPGASTSTFAWSHRPEEPQPGGYTQLWSYVFPSTGTYRVRAVYDHSMPAGYLKRFPNEAPQAPPYGVLQAATPFIPVEVLP